jgi:hypothetical protein
VAFLPFDRTILDVVNVIFLLGNFQKFDSAVVFSHVKVVRASAWVFSRKHLK